MWEHSASADKLLTFHSNEFCKRIYFLTFLQTGAFTYRSFFLFMYIQTFFEVKPTYNPFLKFIFYLACFTGF